jgi:hypothetical protein
MCVAKLMDGTVDNLMDNSSSCCPHVATQAAHELSHDGFIQLQQQIFISYFSKKTVLTKGSTSVCV